MPPPLYKPPGSLEHPSHVVVPNHIYPVGSTRAHETTTPHLSRYYLISLLPPHRPPGSPVTQNTTLSAIWVASVMFLLLLLLALCITTTTLSPNPQQYAITSTEKTPLQNKVTWAGSYETLKCAFMVCENVITITITITIIRNATST